MPLEADLEACRVLLRNGSKTFSAASRLLPRRVRDPATALYAFCRVADDAIDGDPSATEATVDDLRARLGRAYAGRPDDSPVDRALAAVVEAERIPRVLPDALLEGLAWDALGRRYETLDELYAYAARVAGTVGAMMTVVMGPRAPAVLARACDLGVAMQLTNIARDVGEDAGRGRVYLPLAWMREAGIDPEEWLDRPRPTEALASVVARVLDSADGLYRRADDGIAALPRDCRTAIFAARLIYSDIGRYVARSGFDSVTRRAYVPLARKLWLLVRSLGARWLEVEPRLVPPPPPLEPTRFLVSACAEAS
jgi:phytoene synthase